MPIIAIIGAVAGAAIGIIGAVRGGGGNNTPDAPPPLPAPAESTILGIPQNVFLLFAGGALALWLALRRK